MVIADKNYADTLSKIEQLRNLLNQVEESLYKQIPNGLASDFIKSKSTLLNWVEELELTLIEFENK